MSIFPRRWPEPGPRSSDVVAGLLTHGSSGVRPAFPEPFGSSGVVPDGVSETIWTRPSPLTVAGTARTWGNPSPHSHLASASRGGTTEIQYRPSGAVGQVDGGGGARPFEIFDKNRVW